jgi:hypothetical protein
MGWFNDNDEKFEFLTKQIMNLTERVNKLENDARYIADQPKAFSDGSYSAWYAAQQAYNNGISINEVPINGVVKAIVKHLGMEIEKISEQTINKPMEVKVVEKQPSVTITGTDGVTGTTWANVAPIPTPKPKRGRPAKRKTK